MKNLDRFAIADIEAFNTLKAGSGDFNELTRLGLHVSSVSVNGGAKLKNPNFVGFGGISITVVGNDVRISGSGTGGGGTGSSANPVNSGDGIGIFLSKDDSSQYFKTIIGDSGIVVYDGPDGIVIGYTGAGGGGTVTSVGGGSGFKSYGWYIEEQSLNGYGLGPIYSFDKPLILNRFDGSAKIASVIDSTYDIEYSPDYVSWNSIFSSLPLIPAGDKLVDSYVFNTGILQSGWLRLTALANSCAGVTMQLKTMESGAGPVGPMDSLGEAFIYFSGGSTPFVYNSGNISDIQRNGAGDYTIYFKSGTFPDNKYLGLYGGRGSVGTAIFMVEQHDDPFRTESGIRLYTLNQSMSPTDFPSCSAYFKYSGFFGMIKNEGGGGGSSDFDYKSLADVVPSSPFAEDDEFDGLELDQTKWVGMQTGVYESIFLTGNRLYLQTFNTSTSARTCGIGLAVSGSAWEYRCQTTIENPIYNYQSAALVVGNTVTDKYYTFGMMAHTSAGLRTVNCVKTNGYNGYVGELDAYDYFGQDAYLSVKLVSGVLYFGLSKNGIVFDYCTSEAISSHLGSNPDIVGVGNHAYGDKRIITSFDWFRRIS